MVWEQFIISPGLGGLSEVILVGLMAAKMNIKVCLHAGGVGLCNYAAHVCILDFINFGSYGVPFLSESHYLIHSVPHETTHNVHGVVMKTNFYLSFGRYFK